MEHSTETQAKFGKLSTSNQKLLFVLKVLKDDNQLTPEVSQMIKGIFCESLTMQQNKWVKMARALNSF